MTRLIAQNALRDQADVGEVAADVLALLDEDAEDEYGRHDG